LEEKEKEYVVAPSLLKRVGGRLTLWILMSHAPISGKKILNLMTKKINENQL